MNYGQKATAKSPLVLVNIAPHFDLFIAGLNAWDDICAWRKQGVKKMQVDTI